MRTKRHTAIKHCAYALLLIAVFTLQSARGLVPSLWGAKCNAAPFFVAAIALFEGPYAAGAFGFTAGIMLSLHSPIIEGLSALYLLLFGVGAGIVGQVYMRKVAPAALLGGTVCMVLQGAARQVFYFNLVYGAELEYGAKMLAGELALSILPGLVIFYIVKSIHKRFTEVNEV